MWNTIPLALSWFSFFHQVWPDRIGQISKLIFLTLGWKSWRSSPELRPRQPMVHLQRQQGLLHNVRVLREYEEQISFWHCIRSLLSALLSSSQKQRIKDPTTSRLTGELVPNLMATKHWERLIIRALVCKAKGSYLKVNLTCKVMFTKITLPITRNHQPQYVACV